jgi:peroxiredoxin
MLRTWLALLVFVGPSLSAQSRVDLLRHVADRFENANTFSVKGTVSTVLPDSSWRVTVEFETDGAQPAFLPLNTRGPSMTVVSTHSKATETRTRADARDPKPQRGIDMVSMGRYNELAQRLIDAQQIGTETIILRGHVHHCEIIDATYDSSPAFKPHSQVTHERFSIDPSDLLVVRETQSGPDGLEWTAEITSTSFNLPPPESVVQSLRRTTAKYKAPGGWIGRSAPDLTLPRLNGSSVSLGALHGHTVLLDFWASYCGPCTLATRHAQELANRYQSSGFRVLTLTQDTAQDARLWTEHYHVNLPVLLDTKGAAFKAFDVQGVPVAILIDRDGKVVHYWAGDDESAQIDSQVSATLRGQPVSGAPSGPGH